MKLSTAFGLLGHSVSFARGTDAHALGTDWDAVFISTVFTYHWREVVRTIRYYRESGAPVIVGGILASLMPDALAEETECQVHVGPVRGDADELANAVCGDPDLHAVASDIAARGVDALPPDMGLFANCTVPYADMVRHSYVGRTTKGCERGCAFCAVDRLEPEYVPKIDLASRVSYVTRRWGARRSLVLLDDNVLQSPLLGEIIEDIRSCGFGAGARVGRYRRTVDYNQGVDMRLLGDAKLSALAQISLKPLRLALDSVSEIPRFRRCVADAVGYGFRNIACYMLYNYADRPADLYQRLHAAIALNEELDCRIYAFPMKFAAWSRIDRKGVGDHWTRRQLRGVQCILNACHGIVPKTRGFFERAFGQCVEDFLETIQMPENYIIGRSDPELGNPIRGWKRALLALDSEHRDKALRLVSGGKSDTPYSDPCEAVAGFLSHYKRERGRSASGKRGK